MSELRTEHKAFVDAKPLWAMCTAAAEGEHAVHAERETYLPRLSGEDDVAYKARLLMTPWFNATWRTIVGLRGMLFRKPPTLEAPAALGPLMEDVDGAGTTMNGLAQEVVEEALTLGRVGLLVDYPAAPLGLTRADALTMKLRPLISVYEADSVYNWHTARVNGLTVLTQVRLIEEAALDTEDEFATKSEKRYRVLDLLDGKYRQRLYRIDEKGDEVLVETVMPTMGGAPMTFIPFVFIGVDCVGPDVDVPPLMDLVTTNFHHYRQATSYERGCFFSGLPTMFVSGMEDSDNSISIGGSTANALGNPNAKAYYVEVESEFSALRTNLEDKKREMAVLGARMLEGGKTGGNAEAAETVARRQAGEEAVLASMAQTVSQGLTRALGWLAEWAGAAGPVRYELSRDFLPQDMTPQAMAALVAAWQSGAISQETLFDNLKQGEVINSDLTFEQEQERIGSAGPIDMIGA
jgi:hypothetical protein